MTQTSKDFLKELYVEVMQKVVLQSKFVKVDRRLAVTNASILKKYLN
jgi:hypothetical protein